MMPRDTNAHGTIFGGVLLSYIDQAGAIEAARHVRQKLVTVAIKEVVFHNPVFVGDVVSFIGSVKRVGRTSITVSIEVLAARLMPNNPEEVKVTEAELTFVAIDNEGNPVVISQAETKDA